VRALSIGIRKSYQKGLGVAPREAGDKKMEMAGEDHYYEAKDGDDTDDTDVKEDAILDGDEKYVQCEQEKMMEMNQENEAENPIQGMDTEPVGLEDLLGLMKACPQVPSIVISSMYLLELITIYHSPRCLPISRIRRTNISIGMKSWTLATPNRCVI